MQDILTSAIRTCSIPGCDRKYDCHDLCAMHNLRRIRHGDPTRKITREERFWGWVDKSDNCWEWVGSKHSSGYGKFASVLLAHRYSYELHKGKIPEGLQIDHICFNKSCVNPEHLEAVTPRTNMLRAQFHYGTGAAKTECPQGHPYDENNTTYRNSRRHCKACARERATINSGIKRKELVII